ncbi:hypothetical protein [Candidatus Methanomassiliicoccus intestinalis]|uniref:hypothetical protein n=1 Tax=Candidatus Methanomassiliicoccus intestinalis TaxID=1406512 RepID=UPI0037DCF33E
MALKKGYLLNKGDYYIYSATGKLGDKEVNGILAVKVIAANDKGFKIAVLPKEIPFMNAAKLDFPWTGNDLSNLGGIVAGWSVVFDGIRIGKEKVPTPFGDKELEKYMRIEEKENGTLKIEQFVDPVNNFPYGALLSGKSGEVLFGIIKTNIPWIQS